MAKKATQLQKRRSSKASLMKELEGLEDMIGNLEGRVNKPKPKPRSNRQTIDNLESISSRWREINTNKPERMATNEEDLMDFYEEEIPEPKGGSLFNTGVNATIIEDLEQCVLNQIKSCIQLVMSQSGSVDPLMFSLIQGTCKTIEDYEKLFNQLKVMVVMQKFKQDNENNQIIAFLLSNM